MGTINRPIRFTGTADEAAENRETHRWFTWGDETPECDECLAKTWHAAASYPCGALIPRETITFP